MRLNVAAVLLVGLAVGALAGVSIFFVPREPYQVEIFLASTLRVMLVALLTGLSMRRRSWRQGLCYGLLYGFVTGLVVFLAKGGFQSMDAPYVVPSGMVSGAITGLLVARFGFRTPLSLFGGS